MRRRQRDAERENDPDDDCGDDGAAEMIQAAGREIRARFIREEAMRDRFVSPPVRPASAATSPAPADAAASPRSAAADDPI